MLTGTGVIVHASRTKDDEAAQRDGFDCGFLVPSCLNPKIKGEQHSRYWSGLVVHFIHKVRDGSDSFW